VRATDQRDPEREERGQPPPARDAHPARIAGFPRVAGVDGSTAVECRRVRHQLMA
jgi:hypothetical protein